MDIAFILLALISLYACLGAAERAATDPANPSAITQLGVIWVCLIPVCAALIFMGAWYHWHVDRIEEWQDAQSFRNSNPHLLDNNDLVYLGGYAIDLESLRRGLRKTIVHPAFKAPRWTILIQYATPAALCIAVFVLIYRGLLRLRIRSRLQPNRCTTCGYDQSGATTDICSECGHVARASPRIRRRLRLSLLFVIATALVAIRVHLIGVMLATNSSVLFIGGGGLWPSFDQKYASAVTRFYSNAVWEFPYYALSRFPWIVQENGPLIDYGFDPGDSIVVPFWTIALLALGYHVICWLRLGSVYTRASVGPAPRVYTLGDDPAREDDRASLKEEPEDLQ